jgi:hypothetical protein
MKGSNEMTWKLFLDDERNFQDVTWAPWDIREQYRQEGWIICRNHEEVTRKVDELGFPQFVSFDHDLGDFVNGTGYTVAKYLVDLDMYTDIAMPDDFAFFVHSKNPIGKANIEGYLNNYLKHKSEE